VAEGLADPVMEMEELTLTYKNLLSLLRDLKNHGSYAKEPLREKSLMGQKKFAELSSAFLGASQGTPKATFELIIGHAWRPNQGLPMGDKRTIPIKAI
jgi:malonyl-CoA O-methyltransferase